LPQAVRLILVEIRFRVSRTEHAADAIAAAAGTNKMTLYRHIASKDVVIAAAHADDPNGQLLAWLRLVCDFKVNEAERGCALTNAAVELPDPDYPAQRVIREYKTELRELLIASAAMLGSQIPSVSPTKFS
jgi:AcrR family transcriptional regulator